VESFIPDGNINNTINIILKRYDSDISVILDTSEILGNKGLKIIQVSQASIKYRMQKK